MRYARVVLIAQKLMAVGEVEESKTLDSKARRHGYQVSSTWRTPVRLYHTSPQQHAY